MGVGRQVLIYMVKTFLYVFEPKLFQLQVPETQLKFL